MEDPDCTRILQCVRQVQERVSQCRQELESNKSPRSQHDEKLSQVRKRFDEAWSSLSNDNAVNDPDLKQKIADYGHELRMVEAEDDEALKDAQAVWKVQIEAAWNDSCRELVMLLDSVSDQASPRNKPPFGDYPTRGTKSQEVCKRKRRGDEVESFQKKQRRSEKRIRPNYGLLREEDGRFDGNEVDDPIPGEIYLACRSNTWLTVLLLPPADLQQIGIPYTIEDLGLTENVPQCYEYNFVDKTLKVQAEYEDGGPLCAERAYPVMFFDGSAFPEECPVGWVAAKCLRCFDDNDIDIYKDIKHLGQVWKYMERRSSVNIGEIRDRGLAILPSTLVVGESG
ncbi:hypothetical protein HIM_10405 [Hirsutella minnesotensis 3608]|uniref:Uncharacterized protein n=1 Tax=Hirsutella minnesotensis 3608 TaxID=1043627 RepID=A0A0F8A2D0_9HYPO|nr:hypothetical protein HIM_10405 [Hirsutella minnesotensis 3608]